MSPAANIMRLMVNNPLRIERNGDQGPAYFWIIASGYWGYWPLAPATAPANVSRLLRLSGSSKYEHRAHGPLDALGC